MNIHIRYKQLKDGRYSIYLDYMISGERTYEFLKIRVHKNYSKSKGVLDADKQALSLAEAIRSKRQNEIYHNCDFNTVNKQLNKYLYDYIEEYWHQSRILGYRALLNHLKSFSKKSPLLSDVSPAWIERFAAHLSKTIGNNTVRQYLSKLGMFFNKAIREELLSDNPMLKVKIPIYTQPRRTYLTLDELKQLAATPCDMNEQIRQAFLFSCFTGLRISDVRRLKTSDIKNEIEKDTEAKRINKNDTREKEKENTNKSLVIMPKKTSKTTGKLLQIPLSEQALLILKNIKRSAKSEFLFDNLPQTNGINYSLRKWGKAAGLEKKLYFHASRHTCATLSLTSGIDIYTVSKLLGHSSVNCTHIYASLTDDKKIKEIQKFPKFKIKNIGKTKTSAIINS